MRVVTRSRYSAGAEPALSLLPKYNGRCGPMKGAAISLASLTSRSRNRAIPKQRLARSAIPLEYFSLVCYLDCPSPSPVIVAGDGDRFRRSVRTCFEIRIETLCNSQNYDAA